MRGEITNGTTLTFTRAQNTNAVDISWFAVSLKGGNSVQRNVALPGNAPLLLNVPIPNAITVTPILQSVPFISVSGGDNASAAELDGTSWTATLTSNTNLQLQRAGNNVINPNIAWFVVDFNRVTTIADWVEVFP